MNRASLLLLPGFATVALASSLTDSAIFEPDLTDATLGRFESLLESANLGPTQVGAENTANSDPDPSTPSFGGSIAAPGSDLGFAHPLPPPRTPRPIARRDKDQERRAPSTIVFPPEAPTGLSASLTKDGALQLDWKLTEERLLTSFVLEMSTQENGPFKPLQELPKHARSTLAVLAEDLPKDGKLYFQIKSRGETEDSRYSNIAVFSAREPSYPDAVLVDHPLAYLRLGETQGSVARDSSGNGNDGTYESSVALGRPGALAGDPDRAAQFTGTRSSTVVVDVPELDSRPGHAVTVELWMNWDGTSPSPSVAIMPFGFDNYDFSFSLRENGQKIFGLNTRGGDILGVPVPPSLEGFKNKWMHVVAEFRNDSPSSCKLFINGAEQRLKLLMGTQIPRLVSSRFHISGWPTTPDYRFTGLIDEVAVYNGTLPLERIQAHFQAGIRPLRGK